MSTRQTAYIDTKAKKNSQRGTTNIEYSVIKILFSSSSSSASPSTSAIGRKEKNKERNIINM
jgi:hypothetical protein